MKKNATKLMTSFPNNKLRYTTQQTKKNNNHLNPSNVRQLVTHCLKCLRVWLYSDMLIWVANDVVRCNCSLFSQTFQRTKQRVLVVLLYILTYMYRFSLINVEFFFFQLTHQHFRRLLTQEKTEVVEKYDIP